MAIGWFAVLKSVPWSDVISNAPKLTRGAKKLWNVVSKKPASTDPAAADGQPSLAEVQTISSLGKRLAALEASVSDLHSQMLASSALIEGLAEQNDQLVRCIETHRRRVLWLGAAIILVAIAATTAWFWR